MGARVCALDDLASGEARRFAVEGRQVAVVRIHDDVYAIGDTCSHADVSLAEGEVLVEEREIECWKHGSTFSLETGEPQSLPAVRPVPVYRARVEGDRRDRRGRRVSDGAATPTAASVLEVRDLRASAAGREILRGVSLTVRSGEVHAVMGPNGSGKSTLSHVIAGKPGYEVLGGSVTLDGVDLLALEPWQRAQAGLFLALQYPVEVPGVRLHDVLVEAARAAGRDPGAVEGLMGRESERIGFDPKLLFRALNVDLSGGEKKRNETLQLAVSRPRIAILDEIDSGLDIDALRAVSRRIEAATTEFGLGVLAITHYRRLLDELRARRGPRAGPGPGGPHGWPGAGRPGRRGGLRGAGPGGGRVGGRGGHGGGSRFGRRPDPGGSLRRLTGRDLENPPSADGQVRPDAVPG